MSNSRVPIEQARELGAQHGKEAGEAWLRSRNSLFNVIPIRLPEPDLRPSAHPGLWVLISDHLQSEHAYCTAFRAARDEAIRARCEP